MIRALLTLAGLVWTMEVRLLPSQLAFQSDGSTTEGRGLVTVSLGAEYTGQTASVQDYSITFWYQSLAGGFAASGTIYSIKCTSM